MMLTKQYIKDNNIKEYYICVDGMNNDKFARCETMKDVKKAMRDYDKECDGDFEPLLFKYNRETKSMEYIEDWSY